MKMTFRWFGEQEDSVTLAQIRQIPGCTGIMGSINHYAAGEVWHREEIQAYVRQVHAAGLAVEVIESVNVHEDIKLGLASRDKYIDRYIQTIRHVADHGIKVIVYNFMPVFDWLRTDLTWKLEDGSSVLYYDHHRLAGITPVSLVQSVTHQAQGFSLPGWEPDRLKQLERILGLYQSIDCDQLRTNHRYFLQRIIPVCEQMGVRMALHPDDPAWTVFGIPRIACSKQDLLAVINHVDSPANGLCLCTGSLGSSPDNDLPDIIRTFCVMNRVPCAHVRNVKYLGDKKFREASHLSSDGSLDMYQIMKAFYDTGFDGYLRPDHGRMIWGENARPGYGLYDRALGLTYLNGLWEAISKSARLDPQKIALEHRNET